MAAASSSHYSAEEARLRADASPGGWIIFAGLMLAIAGGFNIMYGLAAVLNDQVVTVGGRGVVVWDFTVWGWILIVVGAVLLLTCWGLFALKGWARWTALIIVTLNALVQFAVVTAFPLWAILMITLNVIVLYQLTVNWPERG